MTKERSILLLAVVTAAIYAVGYILSKEALKRTDYWTAAILCDFGIFSTSILVLLVMNRFGSLSVQSACSTGGLLALLAGVVWSIGGFVCYKALGEGDLWMVTAIIWLTEIAWTTSYGLAVLRERFTFGDGIGLALILGGAILLSTQKH